MSAIVEFLEGRGGDSAGRGVDAVLAFEVDDLERRHDFIQWLFPLPEPSRAVAGAPVLSLSDIDAIRKSVTAQFNLARAAACMGHFYETTPHWMGWGDHNHLRITRIIRSLRLLVNDAAADAFRAKILRLTDQAGASVSTTSLAYWLAA